MSELPKHKVEKAGNYESRGTVYTVKFVNEDIVVLFDGTNYRLEDLNHFKKSVESGLFDYRPEIDMYYSQERIPFENIDWVGDKGIKSLEDEDLTTPKSISRMSDKRLLELDSIGEKGLSNIRQWIQQNA